MNARLLWKRLRWYGRRLSRMGPKEVAHRIRERIRVVVDSQRRWTWGHFAGTALRPLGLFDFVQATQEMHRVAEVERRAILAGNLMWLRQPWPKQGSCWWDTNFWRLDPISQQYWPGSTTFHANVRYRHEQHRGDVKFVWEPNRLQMLQPLGLLAGRGDAEAARLGWDILRGWMKHNPPFQGVNWTSGIEAASRIVSVLVFYDGAHALLPAESVQAIQTFIGAHQYFLRRYPSLYSSANNHRVAELGGLIVSSAYARECRLEAAYLEEFVRVVQEQFHGDGVGAEQSLDYAAYTLEWSVLTALAMERVGAAITPALATRLAAAADCLSHFLDEAGRSPNIGDGDDGRVTGLTMAPDDRYVQSVVRFARPRASNTEARLHLRDVVSGRRCGASAQPADGFHLFADGGYTVVRQDILGKKAVLSFDHGPLGFGTLAAHGHADALSVILAWGEEQVIVDPGTYLYHGGGKLRDRFRGTAVHNTLTLAGENQSRLIAPFAWAKHARARVCAREPDAVTARHDGYVRRFGVEHERKVSRSGATFDVVDRLVGERRRVLTWRCGFTLAPGSKVEVSDSVASVRTPAGAVLEIRTVEGAWDLLQVDHSPRFNELTTAPRIEVEGEARGGDLVGRFAITLKTPADVATGH